MSPPAPEVGAGLVEVLRSAPDPGGWRAGMDDDDYRDLARVVQAHVDAAVAAALEGAAVRIRMAGQPARELVSADDLTRQINFAAAARVVSEFARDINAEAAARIVREQIPAEGER